MAFPLATALVLFAMFVGAGLLYAAVVGGGASGNKLITAMFIDAIMVIGIQIYVGNTGVFSFGHIGFGAVAGYIFAIFAIGPDAKATRIPDAPLRTRRREFESADGDRRVAGPPRSWWLRWSGSAWAAPGRAPGRWRPPSSPWPYCSSPTRSPGVGPTSPAASGPG